MRRLLLFASATIAVLTSASRLFALGAPPPVVIGPTVTPDGASTTAPYGSSGNSAVFTITNNSGSTEWYSLSCDRSGVVTSCSISGGYGVTVPAYSSVNRTVLFSMGAGPGSGTVYLTAVFEGDAEPCWEFPCPPPPTWDDTGYYSVTAPPLPAPTVSLGGYPARRSDYAMSLNANFAATFAQSTVPYFSADAARSVTLVYNEERTSLKPIVFAEVSHTSTEHTPLRYEFQVKVNAASVTFLNSESILRFAYPGLTTSYAHRLGGQFDAASYGTGAHAMDVIVTSVYPSGSVSSTSTAYLVIVDERNAPVARGWTISGWQRLYPQPNGSVLVAEGDGSYALFEKTGGVLVSPAGEFSRVTDTGPTESKYRRFYPDSSIVYFNSSGFMTQVLDPNKELTSFYYDGANRPWRIKDPENLIIELGYGANGLAWIRDPFGRYTYVTVQGNRTLTAMQDPDGVSTTFGYDGALRLQTITDRRGKTTTLAYDTQSGKLASVQGPMVYVYDRGNANPTTWFDPWQKDGVPYGSTTTPFAPVRWDSVDATVRAADSTVTRYRAFNAHGQPKWVHLPYGLVETASFNGHGQLVSIQSPFAPTADYTYDASGFMTHSVADGIDVWRRNGGWDKPDSIWGDVTAQRFFLHVGNGRVDSIRVAGNPSLVKKYTYDARGRLLTSVDPEGHLQLRRWYAGTNGNTSTDSLPGGRMTVYGYDTYGRNTSVAVSGLPTRSTTYDALNRPLAAYDGVNGTPTQFAYDGLFLTSVTDPKSQVYGFAHDALGQVIARTDPAGRADSTQYGWLGEVRRYVNRRSQALTFQYDSLLRRTTRQGANFTADTLSYSADGRVVVGKSETSVDTVWLNVRRQPETAKTVFRNFSTRAYTRQYSYDGHARVGYVSGTGTGVSFQPRYYQYAPSGQVSVLGFSTTNTIFGYNDDLQPTTVTLPGTAGHTLGRDFTSVHDVTRATSVGMDEWYHYDVVRRLDRAHDWGEGHQLYGYDGLSRLGTTEFRRVSKTVCTTFGEDFGWWCSAGTLDSTHTFSYDPVGNRLDHGGAYDVGNRITAFDGCSYGYDFDGNITSRSCPGQSVTLTWNALNQLTGYAVGANTIALRYDAFGRLAHRWGSPTTEENYLWDRGNLYAALNSDGTSVRAEYSYYPGLDVPHAVWVYGVPYYAHTDGRGNTVALSDVNKSVRRTYQYDEWGKLIGGSDDASLAPKDRARFKGALWFGDGGLELYYMRNRWYEPRTGRFLSEDPIGVGGDGNGYVFADANPVGLGDPVGLLAAPSAPPSHDSIGGNWRHLCPLGGTKNFDTGTCSTDSEHIYDPELARSLVYAWSLGYKVYLNGSLAGNPVVLMTLLIAANVAHTNVIITGPRAFHRTLAMQLELQEQLGELMAPLTSRHLAGDGVDVTPADGNLMRFARILDGVAGRHNNEIGVYLTDGHIHFGINRRSGSSRYGFDRRGRFYW